MVPVTEQSALRVEGVFFFPHDAKTMGAAQLSVYVDAIRGNSVACVPVFVLGQKAFTRLLAYLLLFLRRKRV
ncbi:MAG TPA: hypothetical protein PLG27_01505 [Candidatus Latescibacteria bacterium]|nr:hypothetical protein [Candidatus Latescibacterota bacterium]HOT35970.1 hypothetical protein [Candidatus Latescibacterota bacterium]